MRFPGMYRGVVRATDEFHDPPHHLLVSIPAVTGSAALRALPCWPLPGSAMTLVAPEVGEGVWVTFEGGDSDYPVYLGFFGKTSSHIATRMTGNEGR